MTWNLLLVLAMTLNLPISLEMTQILHTRVSFAFLSACFYNYFADINMAFPGTILFSGE